MFEVHSIQWWVDKETKFDTRSTVTRVALGSNWMLLMGKTKHDKQTTKELKTTKTYSQIMALEDGHAGGFCFLESQERERKKSWVLLSLRWGFSKVEAKSCAYLAMKWSKYSFNFIVKVKYFQVNCVYRAAYKKNRNRIETEDMSIQLSWIDKAW